ncbi:hypothetical protein D5P86_01550 [Salmonella enterica subsp. enterica serovar Infantis]|nr:hypothetical protein [Salmonella enterica subsp. enterica serovar Infantis]
MRDEDFDFEFEDDDCGPYIDQPLHMIVDQGEYVIGHLIDYGDSTLMIGGYYLGADLESETLIAMDVFKVDPYADIVIVTDADEMRLKHVSQSLTLAFINDIPFVCSSTRH